jgi:signal transduction histidine kinase
VTSKELENTYDVLDYGQQIAQLASFSLNLHNNSVWWSSEIFNVLEMQEIIFEHTLEWFYQSVHPDDKQRVENTIEQALQNKESYCFEHRVITQSNAIKTVKNQGQYFESNGVESLIGTIQDVSDYKKRENELIELRNRAESATLAKSEFLANMSHEIRTPLNAVIGFLDILKDNIDDPENSQYLDIIDDSSKTLLGIIEDILDFSKIESGKLLIDKIFFNPLKEFETLVYLFGARASQNNINLQVKYDGSFPNLIKTDPLRLKQVIANLISNAIKFTQEQKNIYITIKIDKTNLHVSVQDEGIGIAKDKLAHIFEAFNQEDSSTTRHYGGTGLGLAISSQLIGMLGGELKVESHVGQGSNFFFSIPVEISNESEEKNRVKTNYSFNGEKILLVEDNKPNQELMKIVLKKLNLQYDVANDGLEAIQLVKSNHYDAILMDENMPNMNGIDATKVILEYERTHLQKHTPIIALTANALKGDKEKFLLAGMDEYLTKPVSKRVLGQKLKQFIG